MLAQLPPRLRCLHVQGLRLPAGTVAAVLRHTGLSSVGLSSEASALEDPHPLTALQQLTALDLGCGGWGPIAPVVPQPRQFPAGLARSDINRLVPLQEEDEEDDEADMECLEVSTSGPVHAVPCPQVHLARTATAFCTWSDRLALPHLWSGASHSCFRSRLTVSCAGRMIVHPPSR